MKTNRFYMRFCSSFAGIMSNWFFDLHHMWLLRLFDTALLILAVGAFGVLRVAVRRLHGMVRPRLSGMDARPRQPSLARSRGRS